MDPLPLGKVYFEASWHFGTPTSAYHLEKNVNSWVLQESPPFSRWWFQPI